MEYYSNTTVRLDLDSNTSVAPVFKVPIWICGCPSVTHLETLPRRDVRILSIDTWLQHVQTVLATKIARWTLLHGLQATILGKWLAYQYLIKALDATLKERVNSLSSYVIVVHVPMLMVPRMDATVRRLFPSAKVKSFLWTPPTMEDFDDAMYDLV